MRLLNDALKMCCVLKKKIILYSFMHSCSTIGKKK